MYRPAPYQENAPDTLRTLMRRWPFAALVTFGPGGLTATHLPFLIDVDAQGETVLTTHLSRLNPQYDDLKQGSTAMVIFQGPSAYVSPSWYDEKRTFPTWNYAAIHAYGDVDVVDDPDGIKHILDRVVETFDAPVAGEWSFAGIPTGMTALRLPKIAGVVLKVSRLEGALKLNQDHSAADRHGVIAALESRGDAGGREIAALMRETLSAEESMPDGAARA
ncbi:FMN-binding negative transcriptional regulator [Pandoraea sp. NPDC087047]|uniref:FMN-binding negative transcriptional regulator n=1 Tax=Pandoraea sp. NPDC087047 TaxID=3364390 RepID=UPI00380ECE36